MKKFLTALIIFFCSQLSAAFQLTVDGKPNATVVIPENASKMVKYSADELVDFIYRMSGAKLTVSTDKNAANPIFVGFDMGKFEVDQIRIACDGKSLTLTGGGEFGSLMAVYAFLRDQGIFWPYMEEMWLEIPQRKTVEAGNIDIVKKASHL